MLCSITSGWLNGKSSRCGIHLLNILLSCNDHWHNNELYFFVILYLSWVSVSLWLIIECRRNLLGLFSMLEGGCGCWGGVVVVLVVVGFLLFLGLYLCCLICIVF